VTRDRDPYSQPGVPDPYRQPGVPDPYGQPGVTRDRDPYSQPGVPDPYGQPGVTRDRDPYSQPGVPDPYSQPGVPDPYGQPGVTRDRDPYSQPGVPDPYRQPGVPDPYRQPGVPDPYRQPEVTRDHDPYRQPGVNPYGQRGSAAGQNGHTQRQFPASAAGYGPSDDLGGPEGYGQPGGLGRPGGYGPPDGYGPGDYGDPATGQPGTASGPFRWQPSGTGPQSGSDGPGVPPAHGRHPAEPGYQHVGGEAARADSGQFGRGSWAEDLGTGGQQAVADDDGFIPGFDDSGGGGRRRPKRRAGRLLAPLLAIVLLCVLAAGGIYAWSKLGSPDYTGPGTGAVTVQVMPGDTATSLAPRLVKLGVVASTNAFISAAKKSRNPDGLEPGTFRLRKHMSAALAYALLLNPKSRLQTMVTIPDGLRLSQILNTLGTVTQWPASAYIKASKDTAALGLPSYAHGNLEGYLYPATYTFQPGTSALDVLRAMVQRFNQEAASLNLTTVATQKQLTPAQAIVVASLLEAEGGSTANYAKIARVIYNRLKINMELELDSTVLYALHKFGFLLTQAQLHVNSPYNTFTHQGLPPGPIDNPGQAAIEAALHPASGNWLYFVTVNPKTGLTKFTDSKAQFDQYEAECQANGAC